MNKKMMAVIAAAIVLILVVVLIAARPNDAEPDRMAVATDAVTETVENSASGTADTTVEPTVEAAEKVTEPSDQQTGVQPESGVTLPPEVNVSMGVVEGEESGDIDEESGSNSSQPGEKPETPTEGPAEDSIVGDDFDVTTLTYETYMNMSGTDQKKIIDLFSTPEDFLKWFKAIETQYKAEHPEIEIGGDGNINAGEINP